VADSYTFTGDAARRTADAVRSVEREATGPSVKRRRWPIPSPAGATVGIVKAPANAITTSGTIEWGTKVREVGVVAENDMIDIAGDPTKITIVKDGWYQVWFNVYVANTGFSDCAIAFSAVVALNGASLEDDGGGAAPLGVTDTSTVFVLSTFFEIELAKDDYLEINMTCTEAVAFTPAGAFGIRKVA
jgi:hypothetical protein